MKWVESLSEQIGSWVRWFTMAMVIVMTLVVVLRYGFNIGWIALQESTLYLHAFSLMLGMGYLLKQDGHVRVDIFYRNFNQSRKLLVNTLGHLFFLIPTCVFLIVISWSYVLQSWQFLEGSQESGGIPLVFLIKSLILVMPALLILQALSECVLNIKHLKNKSIASGNKQERES